MAEDWRPVVALLANDRTRRAWARAVLGDRAGGPADIDADERTLNRLVEAGLVTRDAAGRVIADGAVFRRLLASHAEPTPTGVDRFLREGRIDRYPSNAQDRDELLRWAAEGALAPDEVLDESTITEHLSRFADDPIALRRYLVDAGLVHRTPTGAEYRLVPH